MKKITLLSNILLGTALTLMLASCQTTKTSKERGLKVGDGPYIPFTKALTFDTVASDVVYNEDGSVSYTATAMGGAGGGLAFYLNENPEASVINTANYDSVHLEFSYSPVKDKWNKNAQDPGFCLRLLTSDSTGIFGGAEDVEYFNTEKFSGDFSYTVKFPENLPARVVNASDYDGIKAFCLKFNDYQRGNSDKDQLNVTLKSVTFNKKENAGPDLPFDDGLTDAQRGTVKSIMYPTKDYTASKNAAEYEKHGWVYLPAGYDENDKNTKYPVFILLHGFGQNENTWGLTDKGNGGKIKGYMDRGIADGSVKPFILVVVTGVASRQWGPNGAGTDMNGFNAFGGELRNDLLPYIYDNFNCARGRENTAIAGLSMGGGQTLNIGIGQCLDLVSYFGAFSAAVFTGPNEYMESVEKAFPDTKINTLYMICGDADNLVYRSYPLFTQTFAKWDKIENFSCDTVAGGTHDFPVWFKGFKNFIGMIFK